MSSPTDGDGKKDDHSAYAPKWVRDFNRETSQGNPSIGEDSFHQRGEQSFPEKVQPAIRPAHIGLSIRPSRETHGLLPRLGAEALRPNAPKITRSPRYAGLAR
jgi:hypothetical protein